MSIFTNRVTKDLTVEGTSHRITIRKLAGRHLHAAALEDQRRSMENIKAVGGPALLKEYMALAEEPKTAAANGDAPADPMSGYDAVTLLKKGIVAWTFTEADGLDPMPVSDAAIEEIDADTSEWLAREIMKLAKPRLFLSKDEAKAEQGNA